MLQRRPSIIRRHERKLSLLLALLLPISIPVATTVFGQDRGSQPNGNERSGKIVNQDTMTNQSVFNLLKAGVDAQSIITRIRTAARCAFQLNDAALIALRKENVPSEIVHAMQERTQEISGAKHTKAAPGPVDVPPQPSPVVPKASATTQLAGTWTGQIKLSDRPLETRMTLQKGLSGGITGIIALKDQDGKVVTTSAQVHEDPTAVRLTFTLDSGTEVTLKPEVIAALVLAGTSSWTSPLTRGVQIGAFMFSHESDKVDPSEVFRFPSDGPKVIARQGEKWQVTLAPHALHLSFRRSNADDAKDVVETAAITQAGTALTASVGSKLVTALPFGSYFALPLAAMSTAWMTMRNKPSKGFEFEYIEGLQASAVLSPGSAEIELPLNELVSNEQDITDIRPVLVRVKQLSKESARLAVTRKLSVRAIKPTKLDTTPRLEQTELGRDLTIIPTEIERRQGNLFIMRTKDAVPSGEYGILLLRKGPAGDYTENVVVKTPVAADVRDAANTPRGGVWLGSGVVLWDFRVAEQKPPTL